MRLSLAIGALLLGLLGWTPVATADSCDAFYAPTGFPRDRNKSRAEEAIRLCRIAYVVYYNPERKNPELVIQLIRRRHLSGPASRDGLKFRQDLDLPEDVRAEDDDYLNNTRGFARGHMAPAENMVFSEAAMKQSFLLSNAVPQSSAVNSGAWSQLEAAVRDWVASIGDVVVITGPIYDEKRDPLGNGKVAVPSKVFKIVFLPRGTDGRSPNAPRAYAFVMRNPELGEPRRDDGRAAPPWIETAVPLSQIQRLTGFGFLEALPDRTRRQLIEAKPKRADIVRILAE